MITSRRLIRDSSIIFLTASLASFGIRSSSAWSSQSSQVSQPDVQTRSHHGDHQAELDARIVQLFSNNKCDEVNQVVNLDDVVRFRPNIIAIIAFCTESRESSEKFFQIAELKDPQGDLVLVLHALRVWKTNPEASNPLWQKVLMLGRNPFLVQMAHEYMNGTIGKGDWIENLTLKKFTIYGDLEFGGTHASNAKHPNFPRQSGAPSIGHEIRFNFIGQVWKRFGSIAGVYHFSQDRYYQYQRGNVQKNIFEVPLTIREGGNEDLVFKPFGLITAVGNALYNTNYGLAVLGIIYRQEYKQSVQGKVWQESLHPASLQNQSGSHFRFDYSYDFFPPFWLIRTGFFVEHGAADRDVVQDSLGQDSIGAAITNSHSDAGFNFSVQRSFKLFSLGFESNFSFRQNSDHSTYVSPVTGQYVSKTRQDFEIQIRPQFILPVMPFVQLLAWFEWHQIQSNLGTTDYANYNYLNQSVGLSLKAFMSNY